LTLALASSVFVGVGAFAGPASADPFLTQDELNFIGAVAPEGYGGDVYATVRTGHQVCSLLDQGLTHVAIQRFVVDTFSDRRCDCVEVIDPRGEYKELQIRFPSPRLIFP
jgi:hypothetical protein